MGMYSNKGLYNAYKKNNKERAEYDYYATPPQEVLNILHRLNYDFTDLSILEPCLGGGHMIKGINSYLQEKQQTPSKLTGSDIKDRKFSHDNWNITYDLDFLSDDYPFSQNDVVIMNPPFSTIEPFIIRGLEIAQKYLIVFGRTQVLEGQSRYNSIFQDSPPTYIYQYVDRIQCWKNGVIPKGSSAQAYCWLVWDKTINNDKCNTTFDWIRRIS